MWLHQISHVQSQVQTEFTSGPLLSTFLYREKTLVWVEVEWISYICLHLDDLGSVSVSENIPLTLDHFARARCFLASSFMSNYLLFLTWHCNNMKLTAVIFSNFSVHLILQMINLLCFCGCWGACGVCGVYVCELLLAGLKALHYRSVLFFF